MSPHTRTRIYRVRFSSREVIADFKDAATAPEFGGSAFREKFHLISSCHIMFLIPNEII